MIKTTCAYCGVGCGIVANVTGARSVEISGDAQHPANHGSLCSKGTHLGETVGLEGRLLYPQIDGQTVGWEQATADVARRMQECIAQYGPDSVAFYVSGQLLTEDYYVANKLMKGFVGSGNIDTNSRLCMASAVAGYNRAFGEDVVPCTYNDLDVADLIVLVGSNTAWCHPVIWQRLEAARAKRGTKLVVIDPRATETAQQADLHIPIDPDGDIALFNALLADMDKREMVDRAALARQCEVPRAFWEELTSDPKIAPDLFKQFADLVAQNPRMITLYSQGANQSVCGTDKANAIINLHLAIGRINLAGAGPFSITGQPNAMGGREVGGLANMLACHLGFSDGELNDVAQFWQTDRLCSGPGLKALDLFEAVHSGTVKFIWVMATNPAVSMPNAGRVREALARCPNVVVSDVMEDTDTGRFAHVKLPALAWGEKDGTVTNSERIISRQRALFPAPGEARADWEIMADVGARMGFRNAFSFANNAAVFREYAAMTDISQQRGRKLDLTSWAGCFDNQYDEMEPFRWGGEHPLADGCPTPDGKARLVPVSPPDARPTDGRYPLRLNTGRYRDQWHTMTRTALSPKLSMHRREPLLEVHPDDAAEYALEDGGLAEVATAHGRSVFRVRATKEQARGTIFTPMHWTDVMSAGGRTGLLAQPSCDPVSGQPGFKDTPATLAPFKPEWRAFCVSRAPILPECAYWTKSVVEGGFLTEFAGLGAIDIDAILPAGEKAETTDLARGTCRIAAYDEQGSLEAALYLTRSGELPPRDWIATQLSPPISGPAPSPAELLAARPARPLPPTGPIVCVCHNVGEQQILAAADAGACSVAEIGNCTKAGTNCGSCRPEIARILKSLEPEREEAAQ